MRGPSRKISQQTEKLIDFAQVLGFEVMGLKIDDEKVDLALWYSGPAFDAQEFWGEALSCVQDGELSVGDAYRLKSLLWDRLSLPVADHKTESEVRP